MNENEFRKITLPEETSEMSSLLGNTKINNNSNSNSNSNNNMGENEKRKKRRCCGTYFN